MISILVWPTFMGKVEKMNKEIKMQFLRFSRLFSKNVPSNGIIFAVYRF